MGRGDKKTKKGKIAIGSFGKTRPHHVNKTEAVPAEKAEKETASTKDKAKKPSA